MSSFIISKGNTPSITAAPSAELFRDALLTRARDLVTITTPEQAVEFADLMKDLDNFKNRIEASRVDVKAPILAVGRAIDDVASRLSGDVIVQWNRIRKLVGSYQAEQRRLEDERKRRAEDEARRIREDTERKIREERERAEREAADLEAKALRARSAARQQELAVQAQNVRDASADKVEATYDAGREQYIAAKTSAEIVPGARIEGVKVRRTLMIEVTNPVALYEAAPYLVTLTPNVPAVKNAIRGLVTGQQLPGVRFWWEENAT